MIIVVSHYLSVSNLFLGVVSKRPFHSCRMRVFIAATKSDAPLGTKVRTAELEEKRGEPLLVVATTTVAPILSEKDSLHASLVGVGRRHPLEEGRKIRFIIQFSSVTCILAHNTDKGLI